MKSFLLIPALLLLNVSAFAQPQMEAQQGLKLWAQRAGGYKTDTFKIYGNILEAGQLEGTCAVAFQSDFLPVINTDFSFKELAQTLIVPFQRFHQTAVPFQDDVCQGWESEEGRASCTGGYRKETFYRIHFEFQSHDQDNLTVLACDVEARSPVTADAAWREISETNTYIQNLEFKK